ncbi:MAG: hypothetical protein J6Y13_03325, partial [Treponema sp.]|nr:hypothetical protein [Treponema sp.]
IVKDVGDDHGLWNYAKLCFNSKYPWEATPSAGTARDAAVADGEVESQQYVLKDCTTGMLLKANATFWAGSRGGVLYRRQFFGYNLHNETHWMQAMNLADFPVANGIIRVDRHRLYRRPVSCTLGAYGFPDNGTKIDRLEQNGAKAIVLTGSDSTGRRKQLAMTVWDGWSSINVVHSSGTNPESLRSMVPFAQASFVKQYGGAEPYVLVSQVITRDDDQPFTADELFPIREISYADSLHSHQTGAYGPIRIVLVDGTERTVDFEGIEGRLTL